MATPIKPLSTADLRELVKQRKDREEFRKLCEATSMAPPAMISAAMPSSRLHGLIARELGRLLAPPCAVAEVHVEPAPAFDGLVVRAKGSDGRVGRAHLPDALVKNMGSEALAVAAASMIHSSMTPPDLGAVRGQHADMVVVDDVSAMPTAPIHTPEQIDLSALPLNTNLVDQFGEPWMLVKRNPGERLCRNLSTGGIVWFNARGSARITRKGVLVDIFLSLAADTMASAAKEQAPAYVNPFTLSEWE